MLKKDDILSVTDIIQLNSSITCVKNLQMPFISK